MRETAGTGAGRRIRAEPGGAVPGGVALDGTAGGGTAPGGVAPAGPAPGGSGAAAAGPGGFPAAAGAEAAAPAAHGGQGTETFRSSVAPLIWWLWAAFAVANLIDLAVQGGGRASVVAAAVLVLVTGVMYVAALRPRVIADDEGIVVRNPLRDHRVPWLAVSGADIADLMRVHCSWREPQAAQPPAGQPPAGQPLAGQAGGRECRKVIHVWAVQSSRRSRAVAELRASRPGWGRPGRPGLPGRNAPEPPGAVHRKEIDRIVRALGERASREQARRADGSAAGGPAGSAGPAATWHWPSAAALAVPALLLIAVILA